MMEQNNHFNPNWKVLKPIFDKYSEYKLYEIERFIICGDHKELLDKMSQNNSNLNILFQEPNINHRNKNRESFKMGDEKLKVSASE